MLDRLSAADFEGLGDHRFAIDFGPDHETQDATLERVSGFNLTAEEGGRAPFSIFLRSAGPPVQATYAVTHQALGTLDLFLVPIEENDQGILFEAVFT